MTMTIHSRLAGGLAGNFQEPKTGIVGAWIANFRRRRRKQIEEAELRSLDARTLADLGIEFAPELNSSLVHSKAEAVSVALTALMNGTRKER
jgi:uncharacterized protein YjiS (DUF1127 family)